MKYSEHGRGGTPHRNDTDRRRGPGGKGAAAMMEHIIRQVGGHVEVYTAEGVFLFSADNTRVAMEELAG